MGGYCRVIVCIQYSLRYKVKSCDIKNSVLYVVQVHTRTRDDQCPYSELENVEMDCSRMQ